MFDVYSLLDSEELTPLYIGIGDAGADHLGRHIALAESQSGDVASVEIRERLGRGHRIAATVASSVPDANAAQTLRTTLQAIHGLDHELAPLGGTSAVTNGRSKPVSMFDHNGSWIQTFPSSADAARETGIDQSKVSAMARGKRTGSFGMSHGYVTFRYGIDRQPIAPFKRRWPGVPVIERRNILGKVTDEYKGVNQAAQALGISADRIKLIISKSPKEQRAHNFEHKDGRWEDLRAVYPLQTKAELLGGPKPLRRKRAVQSGSKSPIS